MIKVKHFQTVISQFLCLLQIPKIVLNRCWSGVGVMKKPETQSVFSPSRSSSKRRKYIPLLNGDQPCRKKQYSKKNKNRIFAPHIVFLFIKFNKHRIISKTKYGRKKQTAATRTMFKVFAFKKHSTKVIIPPACKKAEWRLP